MKYLIQLKKPNRNIFKKDFCNLKDNALQFEVSILSLMIVKYFENFHTLRISLCKSKFTWDPKWTQTGLKSQNALKCCSVYMAIYVKITLRQFFKQWQGSIVNVQMIPFN